MNAIQVKLDVLDAKLDTVVTAVNGLREEMATKKELSELREETKKDLAELRGEMGDLRREMATKLDIAELRQHLGAFRQENQREHLELYRLLREEMYERFTPLDPGVDPA